MKLSSSSMHNAMLNKSVNNNCIIRFKENLNLKITIRSNCNLINLHFNDKLKRYIYYKFITFVDESCKITASKTLKEPEICLTKTCDLLKSSTNITHLNLKYPIWPN